MEISHITCKQFYTYRQILFSIVNGINGNVLKLKEKGSFSSEKKDGCTLQNSAKTLHGLFIHFVASSVVTISNDLSRLFVLIIESLVKNDCILQPDVYF